MNVRPFDWRDLPILHRYRNECEYLDSTLALTRGPILVPTGALLSSVAHATGIFTYLYQANEGDHHPFVAQASHTAGTSSASLTFLAPRSALEQAEISPLVEALAVTLGERGALRILAEADEQSPTLETLRLAGFGVYARQRVWRLSHASKVAGLTGLRRAIPRRDEASVRFLYCNLVPGLVQQVETPPTDQLHGLVYYRGTELLAYIELEYGMSGVWAQPFVHPDAEALAEGMIQLLQKLPDWYARPVYVCVRSYQSWLEPVLEKLGADPGPRQAVMVRHLAVSRRIAQALSIPTLNGKSTEPTVPVAQVSTTNQK